MDVFERLENDGTVRFFIHVQACLIEVGAKRVLDFGAGRGSGLELAISKQQPFKAWVQDLRSTGSTVIACDIDPVVLEHPAAHQKIVSPLGEKLPFEDATFDAIVTDNTFEHVANPDQVANELLRVLKPGGVICARTPSKFGYVALISKLIPNNRHAKALRYIQPKRLEQDVFPTCYLLNTKSQVKLHFPGTNVDTIYSSGAPSYDFGIRIIHWFFKLLHAVLPGPLNTTAWFFIRKHPVETQPGVAT